MKRSNIIIFKFKGLHQILKELEEYLNLNIIEASNEKVFNKLDIVSRNPVVITNKYIEGLENQISLKKLPVKIIQLFEKINIQLIKSQFNQKSELNVNKYKLDLNSRLLIGNNNHLKLTEKEANIILFLYNSEVAVSIDQLQSEVWGYKSKLETHTVETHIYRLRKKLLERFNDKNLIQSKKNGYQIK